ncbi:MAG: zinc metallopeptidase [Verrucomicrobiota bacterium]
MNPEFKILMLFALAGLCALGLPWWAWRRVRSLEKKYGRILLVRGVSGAQAARIILLRGEIPQVDVDESSLAVTDFYSAYEPAIKLSPATYEGKRLFDVARAARLAGHALQHRDRKLGGLASWDSFMILWGNAWPVLLIVLIFAGKGRVLWAAAGFSVLAVIITIGHLLKHTHVQDAARRGRRELEGAKLLDGHPEEEIEAAFLAARLEHVALPYSKTWLRVLFS